MAGALTAAIAAAFAGSAAPSTDAYFEYTTLLLPGNGTNGAQNNTFLDGSTNNFSITRNGNTTQGTFSPFSQTGWGNYFDGTNDYLTSASNADYNLGTTFSVEGWIYSQAATKQVLANLSGFVYIIEGSGTLNFYNGSSLFGGSGATVSRNTWVHVVFTRDASNVVRGFVNGVLTWAITVSTGTSQTAVFIGSEGGTQSFVNGYLSNVRIVKGAIPTSYQTSSTTAGTTIFTPPTSALTAISGTSLLTCQSNRFVDNSTTPKTITPTNGPTVVAFSPFNPTASWSAATYGGSGYFDGSGDYLTVPNNTALNFGTGDFTISMWIYPTTISNVNNAFLYGKSTNNICIFIQTNGTLGVSRFGDVQIISSTATVTVGQWAYIVLSRVSGTTRLFLNGTQINSVGDTRDYTSTSSASIGADFGGALFYGYISSMRIVKGVGVTTDTVPTAPLTAITNTSLLLNFTNAGIYDATSKNDLETLDNTVNGVRISTAQSQFGGSSIYFDGTGTDYLWIQADQPIQRFGTAPFTIELWIRLAATGSARGLVAKGTSTTGWLVSLNTSNQVVFTYGTSTITSTGTISANNWTYIAVVREGTGANQTKIYIGGVNDGTGTVSTDFTQTSSMYIGADRTGGSLFSGYIQDVRITNGYARTVTTIPATAFPTF